MEADSPGDVTRLLIEWSNGDKEALNKLMPMVYDALRKIAYSITEQKGAPAQTLQPTALIHEAYLRLIDQNKVSWRNREQFFAVAAREIRRAVIDEYRKSRSEKRGGDQFRISLAKVENILAVQGADQIDLIAVNSLLDELEDLDERQARIVDLHFFGGLTNEEIAELMTVSLSTVEREMRHARRWLGKRLAGKEKS